MRRWRVACALALFGCSGLATAGENVDIEKELRLLERGEPVPLHISGAKYRVAVFSYEDPDRTGLGDALAATVSREILLGSNVSSIGVLRYEGQLAPTKASSLSYFDKVEKLTAHQETVLAVWGAVRRSGKQLVIDTYVQVPLAVAQKSLSWGMSLPAQMGGGVLRGTVGPNRILVQSLKLPLDNASALSESVRVLDELRAEADAAAPVVGTIPQGAVYWFGTRRADWVLVNVSSGTKGWVRVAANCPGACAKLRDAARFGGAVLQYLAHGKAPAITGNVAVDARIFHDQLSVVEAVDRPETFDYSRFVTGGWAGRRAESRDRQPASPGDASLENLRAVVRIAYALYQERVRPGPGRPDDRIRILYDQQRLDPSFVRDVAFDLAEAAQGDPRNLDVLHNLEVLFRYAGDAQRAETARTIAAGVAARQSDAISPARPRSSLE